MTKHFSKTIALVCAACVNIFVSFFIVNISAALAQGYTSQLVGSAADATTAHKAGVVLAGGGRDNDAAMRWMLDRAAGGDVVVLRTDMSDGYNAYFFSELGVKVNSVETIAISSIDGSQTAYVAQQIRNAEVLFIAGGDQTRYVQRWRGTPVQDAINFLINEKKATVGGTSAGMAILSGIYYAPTTLGVVSDEALSNPYHRYMQNVSKDVFINVPTLKNILTDTHFDQRSRNGRHLAMLARIEQDWNQRAFGIACSERVAVCIDESGIGSVFAESGNSAYFTQSNCANTDTKPEVCSDGKPLTWLRNKQAVKAYNIVGDDKGTNKFDVKNWKPVGGGAWEDWYAENGAMLVKAGSAPSASCVTVTTVMRGILLPPLNVYPNPASGSAMVEIQLSAPETITLSLCNTLGQEIVRITEGSLSIGNYEFAIPNISALPVGVYWCWLRGERNGELRTVMRQFLVVR